MLKLLKLLWTTVIVVVILFLIQLGYFAVLLYASHGFWVAALYVLLTIGFVVLLTVVCNPFVIN